MGFRFDFGNDSTEHDQTTQQTQQQHQITYIQSKRIHPFPAAAAMNSAEQTQQIGIIGETLVIPPYKENQNLGQTVLFRRNLADVKFGVADQQTAENSQDGGWLDKVIFQQTDLIDGVYEGGLKTWECSIDLAQYLSEWNASVLAGKRVMELGCGAGLPGIVCLSKGAYVDFQDYNEEVIHLVTMPNVLLNTISKPDLEIIDEKGIFDLEINMHEIDKTNSGFISGDWGSQAEPTENEKYHVIITSETIYTAESHQKLYTLIKKSLRADGIALIAAKTTYFGCSGSLQEFEEVVKRDGAMSVRQVRVFSEGVQREIIEIKFAQ